MQETSKQQHSSPGPSDRIPGAAFRYLRWAAAIAGATFLLVMGLHFILPSGDLLYREDGLLEYTSLLFWSASCLASFATALRFRERSSRSIAIWIGWIAALAAMRELDLHIWLNPKQLGSWGVRYRIDWWLDGKVSFWLKAGWATLFAGAFYLTFSAPFKFRKPLVRLLRGGDAFVGILAVAVIFLACGFVIDDILRPVHIVSLGTKQLLEETSEMIGAMLFFTGVLLHWRHPLETRSSAHDGKGELPKSNESQAA